MCIRKYYICNIFIRSYHFLSFCCRQLQKKKKYFYFIVLEMIAGKEQMSGVGRGEEEHMIFYMIHVMT